MKNLLCIVLMALPISSSSATAGNAPVIYMIGDSTMANKSLENGNPERGWGQLLPEFFKPEVKIENRAKDGRSSKSFIDEGHWQPIVDALQPGDWVIIQFGHNDQKKDKPHLYADPNEEYPRLLTKFVDETRAKGASALLVTSIYRRHFHPDGSPKATLGGYPQTMRDLAAKLKVPLVDLNAATKDLLKELGEEKSKALFLHYQPGELSAYPGGKKDNTHLNEKGAREVARLFQESIRSQAPKLHELSKR